MAKTYNRERQLQTGKSYQIHVPNSKIMREIQVLFLWVI